MSKTLADKIPAVLRGRLGLALFAVVGLAAAVAAASAVRRVDQEAILQDFERRQALRHAFLQQSLGAYENSLFALRLVAENNLRFDPGEFERAARDIQARSPGIYAIQWAPVVSSRQMEAFLAREREFAGADFAVRQRRSDGTLVPFQPAAGGEETLHAIISYLYPREGNEAVLGYDIFTAPSAPELHRARRSLELTLTRPFRLAQGFDGVIFTCYARRDEYPEGPPAAGPGYIQLVLNLRGVLETLWKISPTNIADFALYDITGQEILPLYTHLGDRPVGEAAPVAHERFVTPGTLSRQFTLGGRTWRACYRPQAGWLESRRSAAPTLLLTGGLLLTFLGLAYLRLLLLRNERIRREVAERTAELSESRTLLDTVIRHSPSAIWVKDTELRFRLVNAEFCRTYGRTADEIIGQTDRLLLPPEFVTEVEKVDREILASGQARHFEFRAPLGGRPRTYLIDKFPLQHPDGTVHAVAGIATDITERRRAETERATMERRLLETQKLESLGVLAGGIAHDFNNLLTGILGHASLCRAQLEEDAPQQSSLGHVEHAARRAAELCQQMLAYSGRGRLEAQPVELGALVQDTIPLLRSSLSQRARLHLDLAPNLPCIVADRTQLRQIVMNLVMNASESFGENEGTIIVRSRPVVGDRALFAACIHAPELPSGAYAALEVSDDGCGMPPETLARIFDPFFTTKFTGRGLGLAAVIGIVRGHQGAVRVASRPGEGTSFHIYLPIPPDPQPAALSSDPFPATLSRPFPTALRILLVDDEESVRETAASILRAVGYEVDTAADGDAALVCFRAEPSRHHAAIIDLTMPGISGRDLLLALREVRPGLPVLLMSGYSETDAAGLLSSPRTAFLAKPFTVAALREKLAALFDIHPA